ncbi:MAG: SxtJ family membrane protein [Bacteroidota bacterium]
MSEPRTPTPKPQTPEPRKSNPELRKFGLVMMVPLLLIGGYLWWTSRGAWPYFVGVAAVFGALALVAPAVLRPVEKYWMKFAEVMGYVMTRVILTLAYVIAITPTGLIMRLRGKDLLNRRIDREAETYWVPTEPDGPGTRPTKPY